MLSIVVWIVTARVPLRNYLKLPSRRIWSVFSLLLLTEAVMTVMGDGSNSDGLGGAIYSIHVNTYTDTLIFFLVSWSCGHIHKPSLYFFLSNFIEPFYFLRNDPYQYQWMQSLSICVEESPRKAKPDRSRPSPTSCFRFCLSVCLYICVKTVYT